MNQLNLCEVTPTTNSSGHLNSEKDSAFEHRGWKRGEGQERPLESMNGALMLRIHVSMSDFLDVFLECFLTLKYLTSL